MKGTRERPGEEVLFPKIIQDVPGMAPPRALKWYPDRLAWQIDIPKDSLKKSEHMQALHKFMVQANDVGAITRQEAGAYPRPLLSSTGAVPDTNTHPKHPLTAPYTP